MNAFEKIIAELQVPQSDYATAKMQARRIDALLDFKCQEIEESLRKSDFNKAQQFWLDLDLQSLQTPYSEIVEMIQELTPQPGDHWMDLGAGYGRMGFVLGFLKPEVRFTGYEFVQARVTEAQRIFNKWNLKQAQVEQADIAASEFKIQPADLYFIYDFGSQHDVYKVLEKLRIIAAKKPIRVIARGRGVKNWIMMDFPWLSGVNAPKHFAHWSLFSS